MRSFVSIVMNIVLVLTFIQAPFQHFHENEKNDHHPHAFIHTHFRHHHPPSSGTEIRDIDPDDDAVFQSWYADVTHNLVAPVYLLVSICDFAIVETSEPYVDRFISGGHDPPPHFCTTPRAPPV